MSFVRNNIIVEQALELAGVDVGTRFSNIETSISAIQTLLQSDNINLDTVQEIVDAIETVQTSLATIIINDLTTGGTTKALSAQQGVVLKALVDAKVAIADIINDVTTGGTTKVLSAQQGVILKGLIDSLTSTVAGKQDILVSGTNIKTINGNSILGSGNLVITSGSSWNSVVIVNSVSDLPAASGGTHTLLDNKTYWFSEGTFTFTDTLTLGTGTNIFGISKGTTILNYTGSGNFINITNKNNTLRNLQFLGTASGTLYNVTNASTNTLNVEDCNINTWGSYGNINGGGYVCFNTIHLAPSIGLTFTGTLRNIIILNSSFRTLTASSYYLRFNNAAANSIRIANNLFDINTNGIGIQQSGTFSVTAAKGLLTSNVFNFLGTPSSGTSGFDHTSTAWRFTGNEGIANKVEELFFSSEQANTSGTGTNPTTAVPAGFLTFPNTGTRVIVMPGGNADNAGLSYDFKMPDDYFSGGEILIQYSNAVGATGNIRWQAQVHSKNIGDSLDTQTETGLGVTVPVVTGNTRGQGTMTPNSTNFAAGKFITIRIYRLGNDAADTANNQNAYIVGVTFKYNAR